MKSHAESTGESRQGGRGPAAISNILAVLRCFSVENPLLGVTEIAAQLGLHKSSVSRILSSLESENVVEQDPDSKKYRLGLGLLAIAGPMLAGLDIRRLALPVLRQLARDSEETTALCVWSGREAVVVEQIPSVHLIKHTVPLGTRYGTPSSASVQVFAAELPPEQRPAGDFATPEYGAQLAEVKQRGYALNCGETSTDVVGVGAGVRDHRGELVAAVIIAAPFYRVDDARAEALGTLCMQAAAELSEALGYRT